MQKLVIGVSPNQHKREVALSLGAIDLVISHGDEAKRIILDATDGVGADAVIRCVGHLSVLAEGIDLARLGVKLFPLQFILPVLRSYLFMIFILRNLKSLTCVPQG